MIERSQDLRFALEAREPFGIEGEAVGQDLERDVPLERRVVGAIHLAHSAFAKLVEDAIRTESIAASHRVLVSLATARLRSVRIATGLRRGLGEAALRRSRTRPRRSSRMRAIGANGGVPPAPSVDKTS